MVENYRDPRLVKIEEETKERLGSRADQMVPVWKLYAMVYMLDQHVSPDGLWGDMEVEAFYELRNFHNHECVYWAMHGA